MQLQGGFEVLPLAPKEREEMAKELFDTKYSAEEWVARFSHTVGSSSFVEYTYTDKKLEKLIYEIHKILSINSKVDVKALRRKYLSESEIKEIESGYEF